MGLRVGSHWAFRGTGEGGRYCAFLRIVHVCVRPLSIVLVICGFLGALVPKGCYCQFQQSNHTHICAFLPLQIHLPTLMDSHINVFFFLCNEPRCKDIDAFY